MELAQVLRAWKPNFLYISLGLDGTGDKARLKPFQLEGSAEADTPMPDAAGRADASGDAHTAIGCVLHVKPAA